MVERVNRAERELNVTLRVNVVERLERDLGDVLDVDVFIYDDDALREHRLTERPDGIHHLARLPGIGLLHGHDHQVVKNSLDRQVDVHNFRNGQLHQRQEDALDRLAHPAVFHRGLAHDRSCINGVLTMGDATDVEHGVLVFERIKAGVVAEGTFGAKFIQMNMAFQNDLSRGGNLEVHSFALHQLDRFLAQEAGDEVFLYIGGSRDYGRERQCRVRADSDRHFHFAAGLPGIGQHGAAGSTSHDVDRGGRACGIAGRGGAQRFPIVFGADLLSLPVHAGGPLVIYLHTIHADVALAGLGVARNHAGQGNETARVFGPALQDREVEQGEVVTFDDFLAGSGRDGFGKELAHLGEHGKHFYFVEKALRRFHIHEAANTFGDFIERVHFERQVHPARGTELVDEDL